MAGGEGCHPFSVFGAAEGVLVEEALGGGNGEVIEGPGTAGVDVSIECSADFGGCEGASRHNFKAGEVDDDLGVGDFNVAGDRCGRLAGGAPVAVVSLVLCEAGEGGCEREEGRSADRQAGSHALRMTLRRGSGQTQNTPALVVMIPADVRQLLAEGCEVEAMQAVGSRRK